MWSKNHQAPDNVPGTSYLLVSRKFPAHSSSYMLFGAFNILQRVLLQIPSHDPNQAFPPGVPGIPGFSRISGSICTYFPSRSRSRLPSDFLYLALYPARTLQVRAPVKSRPTWRPSLEYYHILNNNFNQPISYFCTVDSLTGWPVCLSDWLRTACLRCTALLTVAHDASYTHTGSDWPVWLAGWLPYWFCSLMYPLSFSIYCLFWIHIVTMWNIYINLFADHVKLS